MKSLERRFNNIASENPNLPSIGCFYRAVIGQGFSDVTLGHWFQKLVEKSDYSKSALKEIMGNLQELTKIPEEAGKQGVTANLSPVIMKGRVKAHMELQTVPV